VGGQTAHQSHLAPGLAAAAHGGKQPGIAERLTIIAAGVLHAAIGMEEQVGRRAAMEQRHGQGLENQSSVDAFAHGPADNLAAVEVQDGGHIKPAFPGLDTGDVHDPNLIGGGGLGGGRQTIGRDGVVVVAVGGADAVAAPLAATEARCLHESGDAFAAMAVALLPQDLLHPRAAVSLAALGVNGLDGARQLLIGLGAWAGGPAALQPGLVLQQA